MRDKIDQCQWRVWSDPYYPNGRLCKHKATHTEDGGRYCTQHVLQPRLQLQRTVEALRKEAKK